MMFLGSTPSTFKINYLVPKCFSFPSWFRLHSQTPTPHTHYQNIGIYSIKSVLLSYEALKPIVYVINLLTTIIFRQAAEEEMRERDRGMAGAGEGIPSIHHAIVLQLAVNLA